ncbi:MAG: GTPase ObgE [Anaerolineales bacterium]|nr:GTPase ObgE [Anaerolineales bacterium]
MRDESLFFDEAKIFVQAGNGGNGCVSFRREKFVPHGGPNGGHGGNGGDVILVVSPHLNTLFNLRKHPHWIAERGAHGQGSDKHGKNGADLLVPVPRGTMARDMETGELIADLVHADDRTIVARGGRGGRGNSAFASSTNQAPRWAEKGEPGGERTIVLELKLIADVGIIGLPNAGKSTFLASITAARPKIADYPFTTLVPNLGVAIVDDRDIVLADIPGLIEGAHAGTGLGDKFLRHIERTRVLIHLLDGSSDDPLAAFNTINRELDQYSAHLAEKPQIVGFNKMDLPDAQARWQKLQKAFAKRQIEAYAISAATGQGVRDLLRAAAGRLAELPREMPVAAEEEMPVIRPAEDESAFEVLREGSAFRVRGKKVERVVAMTNFDQEEASTRLHRVFKGMGVTAALERAGIREGDMVRIGEVELEWRE